MNLVWAEVFFLMSFAFLAELISAADSACCLFHLSLSYLSTHPSLFFCPLFHPVFYPAFTLVPPTPCPGINMYVLGWGAHYGEMGADVCVPIQECECVRVDVYVVRQAKDKASGDNEAAGT